MGFLKTCRFSLKSNNELNLTKPHSVTVDRKPRRDLPLLPGPPFFLLSAPRFLNIPFSCVLCCTHMHLWRGHSVILLLALWE